MGIADLHIHTWHSWDASMTPAAVLKASALAGLDVIAVTDHDSIDGSLEAFDLSEKYGVDVITGCEITTSEGHLLALFVDKLIRADLSLIDTLVRIGELGGIAIAPHPAAFGTPSLNYNSIRTALNHVDAGRVLQAVEIHNAGIPYRQSNIHARSFAETLSVAQVGSSDAHYHWGIGSGVTHFPGHHSADLRQAISNRTTRTEPVMGGVTFVPITGWIWHYTLRKLGWVTENDGPNQPLILANKEFNCPTFPSQSVILEEIQ